MKNIFYTLLIINSFYLISCGNSNPTPNPNTTIDPNELTGIPEVDAATKKIIQNPNDPTAYEMRCKAYIDLGDSLSLTKAVRDAEKVMDLDSTKVEHFRLLATAYFENDQSRASIKLLERACEKFPDDIYTKLSLAEMELITQNHDGALITIDKILKIKPFEERALFLRGQIFKEKKDTMMALMNFQMVVDNNPENIEAYVQLGELSDGLNKTIALKYYDNALRIDSTHFVTLMKKARFYHQRGKLDEAQIWYTKAIISQPQNADVQYNLGLLYLEKGDTQKDKKLYEQARKHFDNATKFDVQFGEAYYYKGICAEKLGDIAAAKIDYQNAVEMGERTGQAEAALKKLQ